MSARYSFSGSDLLAAKWLPSLSLNPAAVQVDIHKGGVEVGGDAVLVKADTD